MATEVRKNVERERYELFLDDELVGIADYTLRDGAVVFPHTEIVPPLRGQGLGDQLVEAALDDVRSLGMTVVPQCWFVAQFIDEHPAYRDLVAA